MILYKKFGKQAIEISENIKVLYDEYCIQNNSTFRVYIVYIVHTNIFLTFFFNWKNRNNKKAQNYYL